MPGDKLYRQVYKATKEINFDMVVVTVTLVISEFKNSCITLKEISINKGLVNIETMPWHIDYSRHTELHTEKKCKRSKTKTKIQSIWIKEPTKPQERDRKDLIKKIGKFHIYIRPISLREDIASTSKYLHIE